MRPDPVAGKTLVWTFSDGPMAHRSFQHRFGVDGRLTWQALGAEATGSPSDELPYEVAPLGRNGCVVSYLGDNGQTSTIALDFETQLLVAFISTATSLTMQHGTFEIIDDGAHRPHVNEDKIEVVDVAAIVAETVG
jgi:hypothetical protein